MIRRRRVLNLGRAIPVTLAGILGLDGYWLERGTYCYVDHSATKMHLFKKEFRFENLRISKGILRIQTDVNVDLICAAL